MPKFGPFAASSRRPAALATLVALMFCATMFGADLRTVKEPAKIAEAFAPKAKVRLLNLWAIWCVPCVAEMPDLRAIDDAFGSELSVVGVSLDDMLPDAKPASTSQFLDKQKIAFPNIYYTGNMDALGELLKMDGQIPVTIVFDGNGKELWRHVGRLDRDATIARLRKTLRRTQ